MMVEERERWEERERGHPKEVRKNPDLVHSIEIIGVTFTSK